MYGLQKPYLTLSTQNKNYGEYTEVLGIPPYHLLISCCKEQTAIIWRVTFCKKLRKISDDCKIRKINAPPARHFRLPEGANDLQSNHRVVFDTMFLKNRPVIHLVDESTHFSAALFLKKKSTKDIWKEIASLWFSTYKGLPDYLAVDQVKNFVSKEMKSKADASGVQLKEAPIETPRSIGIVERYHEPLCAA